MKSFIAIVFLGVVALSYAGGLVYTAGVPAYATHAAVSYAPVSYASVPYAAVPYSYHAGANYKLGLDTSLPGSAYASYPYAAAPTAYGYGVVKAL